MSQVKLENTSGLVLIEMVLPDPGKTRAQPAGSESFSDHLWRVQAQADDATAGGQPDAARLGRPQAAAPDAAGQSTAQGQPPADDRPAEGDQTETSQPSTDAANSQPAQTAEAEADEADEAETDDPQKVPGRILPEALDGQLDLPDAGQPTSDPAASDQEGADQQALEDAELIEQTGAVDLAGQGAAEQAALQGDSPVGTLTSGHLVTEADHSEADTQASPRMGVQQTDAAAEARGPSNDQPDDPDQAPDRQQNPQAKTSQQGTLPLDAELPAGSRAATDRRVPGQARQAGGPANETAAATQASTQVAASRPAPADDRRTALGGDAKLPAAEEAVRLATSASPDGRLDASLRLSPDQEPRPAPAQSPGRPGDPSLQVDRARFIQRVARAFGALGGRDASVRLRLSPPELGSLRLEVSVRDGLMTARIEAETPTTRNLLLDNLPALRDRLAQQDIKIKQFDVGLMDHSPDGLPQQSADRAASQQRGGSDNLPQANEEADREAVAPAGLAAANRPGEGTQLNVII